MAFNYTKSKAALDNIAQRTERNRQRMLALQTAAIDIENDLAGMPASYSGLSTEINSEATANPTDEVIQLLKQEKDKLIADFQDLKTTAQSMNTDLASYDLS